MMAGPEDTTTMISPTFSLGSKRRPILLMTMFWEYKPGAILMIPPGSAALMASYMVLNGPDSLSTMY